MDNSALKSAAARHPNEVMHPYDQIIKDAGIDSIFAFTEQFGGLTIYVPNARRVFLGCLEMDAISEYNGKNTITLAKKYGFSERHMRRLVGMC